MDSKRRGVQRFLCLLWFLFDKIVVNTSAVSSINVESILIFASCVINRPLVFTDALSFDCIYMAPMGVVYFGLRCK